MSKIGFLITLFVITTIIFSCDNLDVSSDQSDSFIKFFGSWQDDYGVDIKEVSDGYIILANIETNSNGKDIGLIKVNKQGNKVWETSFGDGGNDIGKRMLLLDDGGLIIIGTYADTLNNNTQIYLIKTNQSGNEEWSKKIGTTSNEEGAAIQKTSEGFILAGSTSRSNTLNNNPEGKWDILLIKTDETGNVEWQNSFGGTDDDLANDILVRNNGFLILGTTNSFNEPGQGNRNMIAIETNWVGVENDRLTYGGINNDYGKSVLYTDDGGYAFVGSFENSAGSNSDVYLVKTQADIHDIDWSKTYGTAVNEFGNDLVKTNNGYVVVGSKEISTGIAGYFLKVDFDGNTILEKVYGGYDEQEFYAVEATSDGGFIMVGKSGYEGNELICLVKVNADGEF
ncbi:MAG: hypothetical protein R6V23_13230 [Bacteroidales bacterium]